VFTVDFRRLELRDFWHDEAPRERGRGALPFGSAGGADAWSVVYLEIAPGDTFGLHIDSEDELVIILSGDAVVSAGDERAELDAGMATVIPAGTPHAYSNISAEPLRLIAIFAVTPVTSTFRYPLQPWGACTVEVRPAAVLAAGD
jgi:quercetin dioxygenase-like cupin family protein